MSGHSKWSTINRQKGVADSKRGQAFTKLSNAITLAVRQGGGIADPTSNFKLRLSIDKARGMNMPKENIERAIERATNSSKESFDEFLYEGFAPGGAAIIVEAATDNKNRTTSEVKNLIEKNGGTMGGQGSVSYMFTRRGELVVKRDGKTADDVMLVALDEGLEDIEEDDDEFFLYTSPESLMKVKHAIESNGFEVENAELVYKPSTTIAVDEETGQKIIDLMEKIEEHDDVQKVYSNVA
jgi:YebC/PmpR family DNA-binding regulatory protein